MTQLVAAKSRTTSRTEANVAFRGSVANPYWQGMAVTVTANAANGLRWGGIGGPVPLNRHTNALEGGANTFRLNGGGVTGFVSQSPAFFAGIPNLRARVLRPVNGVLQEVRKSAVTAFALDYWSTLFSPGTTNGKIVTGNTFEYEFPNTVGLRTFTFGVARINGSGQIGPVATVNIDVTNPTHTALPAAEPTVGGARPAITGRNGSLAAVTGLSASIRASTTRNVILTWDAGAPNEFVVFINWDGANDRLESECTLTLQSPGVPILTNDMIIIESDPITTHVYDWGSARVRALPAAAMYYRPLGALTNNGLNSTALTSIWSYQEFGGGLPKPDATYPNHYFNVAPLSGQFASITATPFHAGTNQSFYETLTPGKTYRAEFVMAASAAMNVRFRVDDTTTDQTVALTTSWQTFSFDFSRTPLLAAATAKFWRLEGQTADVELRVASIRIWEISVPYGRVIPALPAGVDVRDHSLIKTSPISFDSMTSRLGSSGGGAGGSTLAFLLQNCLDAGSYPHLQIEWCYDDQYYLDLITFLCAPASSGEPLALKREALGFGPIHEIFDRWSYEDGNERWNQIMRQMFTSATDSVTAATYNIGQISAMFSARRRAIMESSPYWPASNPPVEWVGGWLAQPTYTIAAVDWADADVAAVALYSAGWDVNRTLLSDTADYWSEVLAVASRSDTPFLQTAADALAESGKRLGIYEAGPGYQLNGLNGTTLTTANAVIQETVAKSAGGCTAMMTSMANAATIGFGPYNFFTWECGPYWTAARRDSEGGGKYRVGAFLEQMHGLLGRCRIYSVNKFITRERELDDGFVGGVPTTTTFVPRSNVFHFESLDYPGRVGILFTNNSVNLDAFGVGHPDYVEGETGAAEFRYHTGLPSTATPFKVLRNEGNFRYHDAYKVGFRPNVVGSAIDGYVADPLCVDLTVTPEDFTVDDVQIRELTLLGGNCRLEVFNA